MIALASIFLVCVFLIVLAKGFRLDGFIYGSFILNICIDLLQFDEVAVLVATLRAVFFYALFSFYYIKKGFSKADVMLIPLLVYTLVGITSSSDPSGSLKFMLKAFIPFFLFSLATRVKDPVGILDSLRKYAPYILAVFIIYTFLSNVIGFGVETYKDNTFLTGYLFGADLHFFAFLSVIVLTTQILSEKHPGNNRIFELVVVLITGTILMFTLRRTSVFILVSGILFMNVRSWKVFFKRLLPLSVLIIVGSLWVYQSATFQKRLEARSNKFSAESIEQESRFLEIYVIQEEVLSFRDVSRSLFGTELFNSSGNYADGKFRDRMIHVDYFIWLHGGGVIGLLLYLLYLFSLPRVFGIPFFTADTKNTTLRLFWFMYLMQFVVSFSGQMYIISFRSLIFIYLALLAKSYSNSRKLARASLIR